MSMAPRGLCRLTCISNDAVNVPVLAKENAHGSEKRQRRRRWTGEIKRKILAATRRPRIWALREDEPPCDVDVEKQREQAPEPKVPVQQATPPRREGAPVLQKNDRSPSDDGAPDAVAVAIDGRRKRKGLRVRFDLPPEEVSAAAPPVQPRFPTGVLGEPPGSFVAHSGADMTAAFLMSVIAEKSRGGGVDSAAQVDRDVVVCWTERKAACSRRLNYLRDYCPFQREEEEAKDEESEPETMTRTRPEAKPGHAEPAEVRPVKIGLPFDTAESEAEFVKAIRSRYLRKDDFLLRHATMYTREQQSLMAVGEVKGKL